MLSNTGGIMIAQATQRCHSLIVLDMSDNFFTEDAGGAMEKTFRENGTILKINVSGTQINHFSFHALNEICQRNAALLKQKEQKPLRNQYVKSQYSVVELQRKEAILKQLLEQKENLQGQIDELNETIKALKEEEDMKSKDLTKQIQEKEQQRADRRQAKQERREMLLSENQRERQIEADKAEEEKQRNFAQHTQNSQKARQQSERERRRIQQELYGLPPDDESEQVEEKPSKPTTQLGKRKGPQITRPMTTKTNSRAGRTTKPAQQSPKQRQQALAPSSAIKNTLDQNSEFDSEAVDRKANKIAHQDSFNDENSFDKSEEHKDEDSFDKSEEKPHEKDSFGDN